MLRFGRRSRVLPALAESAALLAVGILFALEHGTHAPAKAPVPRKTTSGAMQALDLWAAQRAYPHPVIPDAGFASAVQTVQLQQAASSFIHPIDTLVDPWTSIGPANIGGRTLALALRPGDPNTLFAGSASGGLWKSTTGGVGADAWDYVETGFPVLAVSAIAIDPANPDVMYLGTGEVYRYQNSIGGDVDRTTRGSYGIGILKSTDGGATWTQSLDWSYAQTRGIWSIRIHPTDPNILYAATTEGVYKSIDAGGSWARVLSVVMATDLRIHPTSPNIVLVACGNFASAGHGLYRTTNSGATWTKATAGLPTSWSGKAMIDSAPSAPDIFYASISNTFVGLGLYRSFDAGLTWALVNATDVPQWQGWYSHYVLVSPTNVNRIFVGGIEIWKSVNAGVNLTMVSDVNQLFLGTPLPGAPGGGPQYAHADHHCAVWHPTDPNTVFFASDGGVFKTTDGGATFIGLNGGYVTSQFYQGFSNSAITPDLAIGGMQDNLVAIYEGSVAWRRVLGGDGTWTAVSPGNDRTLYGSAQVLDLYRSYDGGHTWTGIAPPGEGGEATAFVAPFALAPSSPNRIYAGRTRVYRSDNEGQSWTATNAGAPLDGSNTIFSLAISATDPNLLFAATAPGAARGRVFRTRDGGVSWTNVTGSLPDRYLTDLAVDPTNDQNLFVTLGGFGTSHVFYSFDRGTTWMDIGSGLPDIPTSAVEVDPQHPAALYVGTDLGVYYSPFYGRDWYPFTNGMPTACVNDLKIVGAARRIRAVTHGNGVYERDLLELHMTGVPGDGDRQGGRQAGLGLALHVAPNPFHARSSVTFSLGEPSWVRLTLFDVAGREVRVLLDEERGAGEHVVPLLPGDLAPAVYFLKLETAEGSGIHRVVVLQ